MSLAQSRPTVYQQRALATRKRRQAKGLYQKPTKAQRAAFAKAMQRGGHAQLTADECRLLAEHPYLTHGQRANYLRLAEAK